MRNAVAIWVVFRKRLVKLLILVETVSEDSLDDMLALPVDSLYRKNSILDEFCQNLRSHSLRSWHFEVNTISAGIEWRIYRSPVGHGNAVKSPHVTEDSVVEILAFRCMNAVEEVV